jgi:hypothetical protein
VDEAPQEPAPGNESAMSVRHSAGRKNLGELRGYRAVRDGSTPCAKVEDVVFGAIMTSPKLRPGQPGKAS